MTLPVRARFVIVGAGVHGLSTAVHLADRLGSGRDVLVLDKSRVGAGASGISGGIVRNFYRSSPVNEIVRQSVEIFELAPSLFGFHQVGYIAVVPEIQADDLQQVAAQHVDAGYASTLVQGEERVARHMRDVFPDWRASGCTTLLHEQRSGWADARTTVGALAGMARTAGVAIAEEVEVTGLEEGLVETTAGAVRCEAALLAPGPWARDLWRLASLPATLEVAGHAREPFHYWQVREGEYEHATARLDPSAPVVHLDSDVRISEHLPDHWGIYFRPGLGGGTAAGGLPLPLDPDCEVDPYGPSHPVLGATTPAFDEAMTTALTWALGRFEGSPAVWSCTSGASQTCFTPDSYPVVGWLCDGVYGLLDSNHGFKMLVLGKLAAAELLGDHEPALGAFRLQRFSLDSLHPVSASPYPWT